MATRTLYILYNADGTVMGKLNYGYRKLTSKSCDAPACAACEITHGKNLSLNESAAWVEAKKEIEASGGVKVVQWHRDEIEPGLKQFVKAQDIKYPAVVMGAADGSFTQVMSNDDLAGCGADPKAFVKELKTRGVATEQASL